MDNTTPEQSKLESNLIKTLLCEQRATRRWKNARFFVWLFLILTIIFLIFNPFKHKKVHGNGTDDKDYVSLIRLTGTIDANKDFSAETVLPELNRAFKDSDAKGVVLLINSPGGSPVQATIIHDKILQLKKKYNKEVIVVAEDTLASGAYLVATAADKIFVSKDTVTGSIGVIMEGFGFSDAISKLGISRRVYTAGKNKDRLDAFMPVDPQSKAKIKTILDAVHQDFINDVKVGRKGKLQGDPAELFSGDFWTGTQAVKLGLADGTANFWEAMDNTFGTAHYRDYSSSPSLWSSVVHNVSTQLNLKFENHTHLQERL